MKVLNQSESNQVAGGIAIALTLAAGASLLSNAVGNAVLFEMGKQTIAGAYALADTYVKPFIFEAPSPPAGFYLSDFNVPASYVALFAAGFIASKISAKF